MFSTVLLVIIFGTSVFHLLPVHSNMHRPHNSGFLVSPVRTLVICTSHQYYSGDQIKKMKCASHVARMGGGKVHRGLIGNPVVRRPLCRPRCRWEDNIKMDLQDVVCRQVLD